MLSWRFPLRTQRRVLFPCRYGCSQRLCRQTLFQVSAKDWQPTTKLEIPEMVFVKAQAFRSQCKSNIFKGLRPTRIEGKPALCGRQSGSCVLKVSVYRTLDGDGDGTVQQTRMSPSMGSSFFKFFVFLFKVWTFVSYLTLSQVSQTLQASA